MRQLLRSIRKLHISITFHYFELCWRVITSRPVIRELTSTHDNCFVSKLENHRGKIIIESITIKSLFIFNALSKVIETGCTLLRYYWVNESFALSFQIWWQWKSFFNILRMNKQKKMKRNWEVTVHEEVLGVDKTPSCYLIAVEDQN